MSTRFEGRESRFEVDHFCQNLIKASWRWVKQHILVDNRVVLKGFSKASVRTQIWCLHHVSRLFVFFFWFSILIQHFYSVTSKLVLRRRGPKLWSIDWGVSTEGPVPGEFEGVIMVVIKRKRRIHVDLLSWAGWYHGVLFLESLFRECFQWYVIDNYVWWGPSPDLV